MIDFSDRGGGIPRSKADKIFRYMYSTAPRPVPLHDSQHSGPVPLAGFGYGLPIVCLSLKSRTNDWLDHLESTLRTILQRWSRNPFHRWLRYRCLYLSSSKWRQVRSVPLVKLTFRLSKIKRVNGCPYAIGLLMSITYHGNINLIGRRRNSICDYR